MKLGQFSGFSLIFRPTHITSELCQSHATSSDEIIYIYFYFFAILISTARMYLHTTFNNVKHENTNTAYIAIKNINTLVTNIIHKSWWFLPWAYWGMMIIARVCARFIIHDKIYDWTGNFTFVTFYTFGRTMWIIFPLRNRSNCWNCNKFRFIIPSY